MQFCTLCIVVKKSIRHSLLLSSPQIFNTQLLHFLSSPFFMFVVRAKAKVPFFLKRKTQKIESNEETKKRRHKKITNFYFRWLHSIHYIVDPKVPFLLLKYRTLHVFMYHSDCIINALKNHENFEGFSNTHHCLSWIENRNEWKLLWQMMILICIHVPFWHLPVPLPAAPPIISSRFLSAFQSSRWERIPIPIFDFPLCAYYSIPKNSGFSVRVTFDDIT